MLRSAVAAALGLSSVGLLGCGEEEPTPPRELCAAGEHDLVVVGEIRGESGTRTIDVKTDQIRGTLRNQAMTLFVEEAEDLILKFVETGETAHLIDKFANATAEGPRALDVVDASEPPSDAASRSDLTRHDCPFEDGLVCAQAGFDDGNDVLDDMDAEVFHATGGTLRIEKVESSHARLRFDFDLELGPNVLSSMDASSGRVQGCGNAHYVSSDIDTWALD